MRIIPVLDLKGGVVVRAQMGRRDLYRPIVTPLSNGPDPVSVAEGLRGLYPFSTFYVADLDAIEGRAPNHDAIARLAGMPSRPELWVDAAIVQEHSLAAALEERSLYPVLGTESQRDDLLLRRFGSHPNLILSLDFFGDEFRGPNGLLNNPDLWPARIIVMTLGRVGSGAGPDFAKLQRIKAKAGNREVVAAGGVRNEADLRKLSSLGISAALVATSLHDGTLTAAHLASIHA